MVLFVLCGNFIRLLVSLVVTVEAVGLALEQSRAFASSRPSDRLTRGLIHGEDVVAVHGDAGHIIGCGAVSDVLDATVILRRRSLGVAVILGDEDYRQRLLTHAEELLGIVLRTRNPAHQIAAIAAGLAGANDAGAGRV